MAAPRRRREWAFVATVALLALLLRFCIGLHPYSGMGVAPRYGDYEAQRHWMELTVHLPVGDWYRDTPDNDLGYWGIDYPPLSAYQSWACGKLLQLLEPGAVELHASRGYETPSSKLLMRATVLAFDLAVFLPAVLAAVGAVSRGAPAHKRRWALALAALQPAALIIDHGHFQYNNISLGLSAAAAAAILGGRQLLGSALFCLALNHKQMALYFAPAFFAHLLGHALQQPTPAARALHVARLAAAVLATFAAVWAPFLRSPGGAVAVLQRLAPLQRGLFEDYVANVWCVSSLAIKWRRLLSQQALVRLTAAATLAAAAPAMAHQIRRPSPRGLLYCMANSALAFFLLSYQVHEKSVLLPLLPVALLAAEEPQLAAWLQSVALFSMFPLLKKDGLATAYAALQLGLAAASPAWGASSSKRGREAGLRTAERAVRVVAAGSVAAGLAVHAAAALLPPPERLPYLHDAAFVTLACVHLLAAALYLNVRQWMLPGDPPPRLKR